MTTLTLRHPCPICGGHCELLDVLDFNKMCGNPEAHFQGLSGEAIYYSLCKDCGFCFAPAIAKWSPEEFERKIYNNDYIHVDPDYVEARPGSFRDILISLFGEFSDSFSHLDYGGGSGRLSKLLQDAGWRSLSYDPFANKEVDHTQLGRFDLITAFEVFEHVPNPLELMERLSTLLTPEGVIFFSTQLSDGHVQAGQRLNWWYAAPRNGHISLFSKAALQYLAQKFQFTLASNWIAMHALYTQRPHWAVKLIP